MSVHFKDVQEFGVRCICRICDYFLPLHPSRLHFYVMERHAFSDQGTRLNFVLKETCESWNALRIILRLQEHDFSETPGS